HDDPHVRKNVADAIARLGPSCISSLQSAFQAAKASQAKNAPYIRLTILNAFLEMLEQGWGTAASEQFLSLAVSALEDESWLVRGQAALVVGKSAQILEDERRKAERHPRA